MLVLRFFDKSAWSLFLPAIPIVLSSLFVGVGVLPLDGVTDALGDDDPEVPELLEDGVVGVLGGEVAAKLYEIINDNTIFHAT